MWRGDSRIVESVPKSDLRFTRQCSLTILCWPSLWRNLSSHGQLSRGLKELTRIRVNCSVLRGGQRMTARVTGTVITPSINRTLILPRKSIPTACVRYQHGETWVANQFDEHRLYRRDVNNDRLRSVRMILLEVIRRLRGGRCDQSVGLYLLVFGRADIAQRATRDTRSNPLSEVEGW